MLRVEALNLPNPRGAPRSRQLLPGPLDGERWSVQLELSDDEVAKLYGHGLARGAVVWRKGLLEWRPLLSTPELTGLLRRTRVTTANELAVPRPPRVPSVVPEELADQPVPTTTVSPTAMDVAVTPAAPAKPRRQLELAFVAAAAFAAAWLGHGMLHPAAPSEITASAAPSQLVSPLPACETRAAETSRAVHTGSSIPTVAVADLPLLGESGRAATGHAVLGRAAARSVSSSGAGPSRSDLVSALSQVARVASGCGERGGPVRVVVSFANSGVARSIRVSGSDLPATTRSCIIGAASRARISAFSGDSVTVGKTL